MSRLCSLCTWIYISVASHSAWSNLTFFDNCQLDIPMISHEIALIALSIWISGPSKMGYGRHLEFKCLKIAIEIIRIFPSDGHFLISPAPWPETSSEVSMPSWNTSEHKSFATCPVQQLGVKTRADLTCKKLGIYRMRYEEFLIKWGSSQENYIEIVDFVEYFRF